MMKATRPVIKYPDIAQVEADWLPHIMTWAQNTPLITVHSDIPRPFNPP